MKIFVISTDVSKFNETGFGSIDSCRYLYEAIKDKYKAQFVIITSIQNIYDIINEKPDLVICGFKYFIDANKNKYWITELLEKNNINFLGSTRENITYDSKKVKAKNLLIENNINTPKFFVTNTNELKPTSIKNMKFPLFVKPTDAACSFGVDNDSLVDNFDELIRKVNQIEKKFAQYSLVEEFLPGKEYTAAVIGNDHDLQIGIIELRGPEIKTGIKFLARDIKVANLEYHNNVIEENYSNEIILLTKKVYKLLGARDIARIDIKIDTNNKPSFLEINMFPGFSKGRSYFPIAFEKNFNMTYDDTVNKAVEAAIKRIGVDNKNYE